jgi:hypothetical protein
MPPGLPVKSFYLQRGVALRIRLQQPAFDKRVRGESSFAGSNPALSADA